MDKNSLLKLISEKLGISQSQREFAFEFFLEKISNNLQNDEAINIPEIGFFQLKASTDSAKSKIYFSPHDLSKDQLSQNLYLSFDVDTSDEISTEFDESVFSIGVGKPIIPAINVDESDDPLLASLQKSLEDRVGEILSNSNKVSDFDLFDNFIIQQDEAKKIEEEKAKQEELEAQKIVEEQAKQEEDIAKEIAEETGEETTIQENTIEDVVEENISMEDAIVDSIIEEEKKTEDDSSSGEMDQSAIDDMFSSGNTFDEMDFQIDGKDTEDSDEENSKDVAEEIDKDIEEFKKFADEPAKEEPNKDLEELLSQPDEENIEEPVVEQENVVESEPVIEEPTETLDVSESTPTPQDFVEEENEDKDLLDSFLPGGVETTEVEPKSEEEDDSIQWDWGDELKTELEEQEDKEEKVEVDQKVEEEITEEPIEEKVDAKIEESKKEESDSDDPFGELSDLLDDDEDEEIDFNLDDDIEDVEATEGNEQEEEEKEDESKEEQEENEPEEEEVEEDSAEDELDDNKNDTKEKTMAEELEQVEEDDEDASEEKPKKLLFNKYELKSEGLGKTFWIVVGVFVAFNLIAVSYLLFFGGSSSEPVDETILSPDSTTNNEIVAQVDTTNTNPPDSEKIAVAEPIKTEPVEEKPVEKPPVKFGSLYREIDSEQRISGRIYLQGTRYMVQASSFKIKARAENEVKRLRGLGHDAFIVEVFLEQLGGTWYRVRIGYFNSRQEAQSFITSNEM